MNPSQIALSHPVISASLGVVFLLVILLGTVHVVRVFGGFLEVLVHEFKYELSETRKVFTRIKRELTTWRSHD